MYSQMNQFHSAGKICLKAYSIGKANKTKKVLSCRTEQVGVSKDSITGLLPTQKLPSSKF